MIISSTLPTKPPLILLHMIQNNIKLVYAMNYHVRSFWSILVVLNF